MAPTPCLLREYSLDSSLRSTLRRKLSLNCVGTSVLMGRLYVVATPIGNLEDMSLRALRALGDVGLIVAEDTRTAHVLLRRHHLKNRLLSYNEHNKARRIPEILARLVETDAALVSDAGTPAISDPGVELVAAVRAAGHVVVAVPGASAVVAALSVAGLRTTSFRFVGFLPRTTGELRRLLEEQAGRPGALVAVEAPQGVGRRPAAPLRPPAPPPLGAVPARGGLALPVPEGRPLCLRRRLRHQEQRRRGDEQAGSEDDGGGDAPDADGVQDRQLQVREVGGVACTAQGESPIES